MKIYWRDEAQMESFLLHFRTEEILKQWHQTLYTLINPRSSKGMERASDKWGSSYSLRDMDLDNVEDQEVPAERRLKRKPAGRSHTRRPSNEILVRTVGTLDDSSHSTSKKPSAVKRASRERQRDFYSPDAQGMMRYSNSSGSDYQLHSPPSSYHAPSKKSSTVESHVRNLNLEDKESPDRNRSTLHGHRESSDSNRFCFDRRGSERGDWRQTSNAPSISSSSSTRGVKIKIKFENEIHVLNVPSNVGYLDLKERVEQKLSLADATFRISYKDEEADMIVINCDDDVMEAWECKTSKSLVIYANLI